MGSSVERVQRDENAEMISHVLRNENLSSLSIAKKTGLSQPTVSRTLKRMPAIKLGGGRGTTFALVVSDDPLQVYQIDATGNIIPLAEFYRQYGDRSLVVCGTKHFSYKSLPFYLYDSLPAGFLGVLALKKISESDQSLTTKSQEWNDSQVLHYLTHYGSDLAGNLIFSKDMASMASKAVYEATQRKQYSEIAATIKAMPSRLGSSIAGEQPKFTVFNGVKHLIVKYSPLCSEKNPVATRHRDLMVCEHLALETLNEEGIPAAKSNLYAGDRFFLEIERFDRIGTYGRRGIVSLKNLDAEYVGKGTNWVEIGKELLALGLIKQKDFFLIEVAEAFGIYIGNTDRHNGNFSFFMGGLDLVGATPIYDMLPMAYIPIQGEINNPEFSVPRYFDCSTKAVGVAKAIALKFWEKVILNDMVSEDFKVVITPYLDRLSDDA